MTKPVLIQRQRAQLRCASREAEGYLELGMHKHALQVLQRRGKLVHADGRACYLMGESLRELSRYREALYPLRRSALLRPDEIDTWLAIGWCYKRTGQINEAIIALERAVELDPSQAIIHYNLACYYSLAHRRMAALRRLKLAFAIDGNLSTLVASETDFEPIRNDPGFQILLTALSL